MKHLRYTLSLISLALLVLAAALPANAQLGQVGIHDPSRIHKVGNRYYLFGTGEGIVSKYSDDLVQWTDGPTVFPRTSWPSWINGRVPAFAGNFWAPDVIYVNGKYHLYYSCSTFGVNQSAIGLVTNVTLDPNDPAYAWQDQGEVVFTTTASNHNAIDAAPFLSADGSQLFLAYGSYWTGLKVTQLNRSTGKSAGQGIASIASGDREAAYVQYMNGYYYLFLNNGSCCQGLNSTYYMQVGRSASPTGPYLDKQGNQLGSGGGTQLLAREGRYIGPGHVGLYEENGATFVTHHYYDQYENGAPKLGMAGLFWGADGWPVISRNWEWQGRYEIENLADGNLWKSLNCTGGQGEAIATGPRTSETCQQFDLTQIGRGDYQITATLGGRTVGAAGCASAVGTGLSLGSYSMLDCERVHLLRAVDGSYVITSLADSRTNVNNVVQGGAMPSLATYNGATSQRWRLVPVANPNAAKSLAQAGIRLYPTPATRAGMTLEAAEATNLDGATVRIFDALGRQVAIHTLQDSRATAVGAGLAPGVYALTLRHGAKVYTESIVIE